MSYCLTSVLNALIIVDYYLLDIRLENSFLIAPLITASFLLQRNWGWDSVQWSQCFTTWIWKHLPREWSAVTFILTEIDLQFLYITKYMSVRSFSNIQLSNQSVFWGTANIHINMCVTFCTFLMFCPNPEYGMWLKKKAIIISWLDSIKLCKANQIEQSRACFYKPWKGQLNFCIHLLSLAHIYEIMLVVMHY